MTLTHVPAPVWAGGESGGGGDARTELRIDTIRADILDWIGRGGGSDLKFAPNAKYEDYRDAMSRMLEPHEVIIGSVTSAEEDATQDPEQKVVVNGQRKTCRGFVSTKDSRRHLLCNVERFAATSESDQYMLIHHEYAGLARVEQNVGASSDYSLSSQITDYLVPQTVLKLAVRKPEPEGDAPALAATVQDLWETIKRHKLLLPKGIEASYRAQRQYGLIKLTAQTQLGRVSDDSPFPRIFPIWISFAFNPAHPGDLAFAELRGAIVEMKGAVGKGTILSADFGKIGYRMGLDGSTSGEISEISAGGYRVEQYFNIDARGEIQLYLKGAAHLAVESASIQNLDLSEDRDPALLGSVGLRLFDRLLVRGKAQLNYLGGYSDQSLSGWAPSLGANVSVTVGKRVNVYSDLLRTDLSDVKNNQGFPSVIQSTTGVMVDFW